MKIDNPRPIFQVVTALLILVSAFSKARAEEQAVDQFEIFDHLLAVAPEFGLRVFQSPTGADFRRL